MLSFAFPRYRSFYDKEEKILDRARIRILSTLITLYAALFTSLSLFYTAQERNYLLLRAGFVAVILILIFFLLVKGINWRSIAHAFIFCITILIWANILFIRQGINLVTGQYVVLIVTCGFYLLEERWGLIYSIFNIVPLVVFVFLNDYFASNGYTQFQTQNSTAYHVIRTITFSGNIKQPPSTKRNNAFSLIKHLKQPITPRRRKPISWLPCRMSYARH